MPQESKNLNTQQQNSDDMPNRGTQAVMKTLHYIFVSLRFIIGIGIILIFFQGVFFVHDYEEAMLFRFGKLIKKQGSPILESGRLYWAWPYPIDEVKRIPANRSITIESSQFWPRQEKINIRGKNHAQSNKQNTGLAPGKDGYLLTGDANIIHMIWNVTYQVENAKKYYLDFFSGKDGMNNDAIISSEAAEDIVKHSLENAVLKEIAEWSIEDVIRLSRQINTTPDKAEGADQAGKVASRKRSAILSDVVEERLRSTVSELELGIDIQQVSLTNMQPPVVTAQAFREVLEAAQEYERALENAETYRNRTVNQAEGKAANIIADAKAYKKRVVSSVKADKDYFLKVFEEYQQNPETMLVALYTDTIKTVLENVKDRYIINSRKDGRQEIRINLGKHPDSDNSNKQTE